MHLVNGTGNSPSPGRPSPGVVKQDKSSGGSVDTTKTRSGPRRVRMSGGERPIGAAKGKRSDTEALCQSPPPPHTPPVPPVVSLGACPACQKYCWAHSLVPLRPMYKLQPSAVPHHRFWAPSPRGTAISGHVTGVTALERWGHVEVSAGRPAAPLSKTLRDGPFPCPLVFCREPPN